MASKSLEQIWQEMQLQTEAKKKEEIKQKEHAEKQAELARQKYVKESVRIFEQSIAFQNSVSSSSAGGTFCGRLITHTNTMWLYPEVDVNTGLTGTTYSYSRNGDNLVFENIESLVQVYLAIVNASLISQPIPNAGYSMGVGTKLLNKKKPLNFVLSNGDVIVKWILVEQLTDQSELPVGGQSPKGTIGFVTTFTIWKTPEELPDPYLDMFYVKCA